MIRLNTCLLAMTIMLITFNGRAEEAPDNQAENWVFAYGGELDFNSRYVWRGIALSDGPVVQPSVWASAYDLTLEAWGNFVLDDEPNQGEFNEINLILYYSQEWKYITIEPSVIVYLYPNQEDAPATAEASLTFSYPIGPINVFTDQFFDFIEYGGSYFGDAGLSYQHEFKPELFLDFSTSLGWASAEFNKVNIGLSKNALNVLGGGLSLTYYPKKFLYIRPHAELSAILDGDLRDELEDSTILNAGIVIGMEF